MYDTEGNLLKVFPTSFECADFFDKPPQYIYYNIKYFKKIRKDGKWYVIKRS
jgi:hypothetical protein